MPRLRTLYLDDNDAPDDNTAVLRAVLRLVVHSVHTPLGLFFARLRSMADFFSQILPTPHAPAVLSVSRTATANCLEERERDAPCREPRLTALIRLQAVQLGLQSCG